MPPENDLSAPAPTPSAAPAAATVSAVEFQRVQALLIAEQQAHNATKASMETVKGDITQLTSTVGLKDANITDLQKRLTGFEKIQEKATRLEVIINDFPDLIPFEKDGLLPSGSDKEVLKASFTKFSERIKDMTKANTADYNAGGKPEKVPASDPKLGSPDNPSALLQAAVQAQQNGDMAGYEENFNKYLLAKNKQVA